VLLTRGEIADGGAELAAGRVVDLPRIPPGLRGHLFVGAGAGAHLVSGRTLRPAGKKSG